MRSSGKKVGSSLGPAIFGAVALASVGVGLVLTVSAAEEATVIPAPVQDERTGGASETAVFAGGCFWGVQGVFQHVKGVASATSGYAGGPQSSAQYETVSTGSTGHAESVEIVFDPSKLRPSAPDLLFGSARPNATQSPGAGYGHPVSLGDLPADRRAVQGRQGLHRPVESCPRL